MMMIFLADDTLKIFLAKMQRIAVRIIGALHIQTS